MPVKTAEKMPPNQTPHPEYFSLHINSPADECKHNILLSLTQNYNYGMLSKRLGFMWIKHWYKRGLDGEKISLWNFEPTAAVWADKTSTWRPTNTAIRPYLDLYFLRRKALDDWNFYGQKFLFLDCQAPNASSHSSVVEPHAVFSKGHPEPLGVGARTYELAPLSSPTQRVQCQYLHLLLSKLLRHLVLLEM